MVSLFLCCGRQGTCSFVELFHLIFSAVLERECYSPLPLPFYRWEHWHLKKLRHFPENSWLLNDSEPRSVDSKPVLLTWGLTPVFCKQVTHIASKHFVYFMNLQPFMALPLICPPEGRKGARKNASPISHSGPAALTEAPKFSPCTGTSGHLSSSEWSHKLDTRDSWGLWQFRVFSLVTPPHISQDVVLCHSGSQHLLQACSLSDFSPLRSGVVQKKESDCVPTWSLSCSPSDLTPGVGLLIYKTGWG